MSKLVDNTMLFVDNIISSARNNISTSYKAHLSAEEVEPSLFGQEEHVAKHIDNILSECTQNEDETTAFIRNCSSTVYNDVQALPQFNINSNIEHHERRNAASPSNRVSEDEFQLNFSEFF